MVKGLLVALGLLVWTKPAFAYLAASAASFVPYGPSDVDHIQHSTTQVYNTDPNGSHYVIAHLGVASFNPGSHGWFLQFSTSAGGVISCWTTAIRIDGYGTTYQVGMTNLYYPPTSHSPLGMSLNVQTGGKYAVTYTCLLPPASANMSLEGVSD
jgi:hypothetical protein